jgi:general stress protein 26
MNHLYRLLLYPGVIMTILPFQVFSQNTGPDNETSEKLMTAAREIIESAATCALITLDDNNLPMVRTMDPFTPEADFTIWLGTNSESRKVNHIKNNPNVSLYYQDGDDSGYVVIHGKAQIIDDEQEKQKRWKKEWEAFYPNNRDGYLLIKVSPEWMEILSITRGINGDPRTWKTPVVRFD